MSNEQAHDEEYLTHLNSFITDSDALAITFFKEASQDVAKYIPTMLRILGKSNRTEIRSGAITILRKTFPAGGQNIIDDYASCFLNILKQEPSEELREKLTEYLNLSQFDSQNSVSEKLVQLSFPNFSDENPTVVETFINLVGCLMASSSNESMPNLFTELVQHLRTLLGHKNTKVQVAAVKCIASVSPVVSDMRDRTAKLCELAPLMLTVLQNTLNAGDIDMAVYVIDRFIEINALFVDIVSQIISAMYTITKTKQLGKAREKSFEFIVTFVETSPKVLMKKMPKFLDVIIPLCVEVMAEGVTEEVVAVDDAPETYKAGLEAIDAISKHFGGKRIAPVILKLVTKYLKEKDWRMQVTAVMLLAYSAEACKTQYAELLEKLLTIITELAKDKLPRVRYAAAQVIGQFFNDIDSEDMTPFHLPILSTLMPFLSDSHPMCKKVGVDCMINCLTSLPKEILVNYVDSIMNALLKLNEEGDMYSYSTLDCFAAIADNVEEEFLKYYEKVLPIVIPGISSTEKRMRESSWMCCSLIATSVKKDKFGEANIKLLMDSLLHHIDHPTEQVMDTLQRMIICLGSDFTPYVKTIIPKIFLIAYDQVQIRIFDTMREEDIVEEEGFEYIGIQHRKIGISMKQIENKSRAICCLHAAIVHCSNDMVEYAQELTNLFPLISFAYSDEVRLAIFSILPSLLKFYKEQNMDNFCERIIEILITKITENNEEELDKLLISLRECLEVATVPRLETNAFVPAMLQIINDSVTNITNKIANREEDDEEDLKDEMVLREALVLACVYYEHYDAKLDTITKYLLDTCFTEGCPEPIRDIALEYMSLLVKHGKAKEHPNYKTIVDFSIRLHQLLQANINSDGFLAYLFVYMIRFGGSHADPFIDTMIKFFEMSIQHQDRHILGGILHTIFTIMLTKSNEHMTQEFMDKILSCYPLEEDDGSYDALVELMLLKNEYLMGERKNQVFDIIRDGIKRRMFSGAKCEIIKNNFVKEIKESGKREK